MTNTNGGAKMDDTKDMGEQTNLRVASWTAVNYELTRLDQDIREVKAEIRDVKADIRKLDEKIDRQVGDLRTELREEIKNLREEMHTDIKSVRDEVKSISEKTLSRVTLGMTVMSIIVAAFGIAVTIVLTLHK